MTDEPLARFEDLIHELFSLTQDCSLVWLVVSTADHEIKGVEVDKENTWLKRFESKLVEGAVPMGVVCWEEELEGVSTPKYWLVEPFEGEEWAEKEVKGLIDVAMERWEKSGGRIIDWTVN